MNSNDDRLDQRTEEEVADRLSEDDNVDPSDITIHAEAGEVILNGMVNSEDEKRAAETAAEQVADVDSVTNQLRVRGQETGDQIGRD